MVTLLRELSLFTGYGGMSLGLKLALEGVRTETENNNGSSLGYTRPRLPPRCRLYRETGGEETSVYLGQPVSGSTPY